ncbi:MAG: dihydropteroate synthase [Deltaproteobacteria bacterium]|nr:dihydropteroate synthase [Deltaproteobacteria bacterium]
MFQERGELVSWGLCRGRTLGPAPFFVVGIVNVTPDSFYDGGLSARAEDAVAAGLRLLEQGADMIDVGGESTRPFAAPVSVEEEIARVLPVVRGTLAVRPDAVVSVDTTKALAAKACLEAGALVVNDVSALDADPDLLGVVLDFQPGYVLMHNQGSPRTMQVEPKYGNVVDEIQRFFEIRMTRLVQAGLGEERIVLDPGIGFGKTLEHNLEILRNITVFQKFGRPVYMGLSNKSLWRGLLGREGRERNAATLAATVTLYAQGIRIHRVHEVRETRDALVVARTLMTGQGEPGC